MKLVEIHFLCTNFRRKPRFREVLNRKWISSVKRYVLHWVRLCIHIRKDYFVCLFKIRNPVGSHISRSSSIVRDSGGNSGSGQRGWMREREREREMVMNTVWKMLLIFWNLLSFSVMPVPSRWLFGRSWTSTSWTSDRLDRIHGTACNLRFGGEKLQYD